MVNQNSVRLRTSFPRDQPSSRTSLRYTDSTYALYKSCSHSASPLLHSRVAMGFKSDSVPAGSSSPLCASKFPSTIALSDGKKMLNFDSPKGSITATTGMMTSPLSSVHHSPVDSTRKSRHPNVSRQHIDEHLTESHKEEQQIPRSSNKQRSKTSRRKQQSSSTRHESLTWRMNPDASLSDFTLSIIGIEDKDAIHKHLADKEKRRKKKRSKRRDQWMVEGLYLDMSRSEDNDGECSVDVSMKTNETPPEGNYLLKEQYHLHKVNLAVGLRSCEYFARLFQKMRSSAGSNLVREHTLELPKSSLQAIPAMLDYLYDPDPTVQVNATTTTAIPLRYLGKYLGNPLLFDSATRFLQMDLRKETAVTYLQQAEIYKQKKLAEVCARVCAESFTQIKMTSLSTLEPHLMKKVLHSKYFRPDIDSRAICAKIASYCRCQDKSISTKMFLSLTSENVMQNICEEEALFFIQFMIGLGIDVSCDNQKAGRLFERCVLAAPHMMQEVVNSSRKGRAGRIAKNASGSYAKLPPQIKVQLLEFALTQQQHL